MDQARALALLQETDIAIARLERRLTEMPEKRAILDARKRIDDIEALRERTDSFIHEIERVVSALEDEVASLATKIDSEQAKLLSGKIVNPKEVQHISRELDSLRRRKDKIENDILVQMEKRERALEQGAKVDAAREAARAKEEELVEGFKGKGGTLQQEIGEYRAKREELRSQLDPDIASAYEEHRGAKGGVGLGILLDGMCSACRMELPADRVDELLAGPQVSECPLCHRLLVVRTQEGDEPG